MTITNKLFNERVLKIDVMKRHAETTYNFSEACDFWFSVELTKDEVREFAGELLKMVEEI